MRFVGVFVWCAIQPINCFAQAADGNLQTFIHSQFYGGLINQALAAMPPTVFQKCPTLVSNSSQVTVIRPVTFATSGFPNAGFWKQSFPVSGCGNDTTLNIFFLPDATEKTHTLLGAPGDTRADYRLQTDALTYARTAAYAVARDCEPASFQVRDTKFEGFDVSGSPIKPAAAGSSVQPWRETWTIIGCGHTVNVPIYYLPDAKGMQIVAGGASRRG